MSPDNIFEQIYTKVEQEMLMEGDINTVDVLYQIGRMFLRELSYHKNTEVIKDKIPNVIKTLENIKSNENHTFARIYLDSIAIFMKNSIAHLRKKGEDTSKIEDILKNYNDTLPIALQMLK